MRSARGIVRHGCFAVCFGALFLAGTVQADVTTERSSSVLIFPKVVYDPDGLLTGVPGVDTLIQITNTSNTIRFLHCFYINAAPLRPELPVSVNNPRQWQEINFDLFLTRQQPTSWVVGDGRFTDPSDPICQRGEGSEVIRDCADAGFDPGLVPLVPDPFIGELKCVEVDSLGGAPISGNHFKGEATIVTGTAEVSKYNAIGVYGLPDSNDSDLTLCLGGGVSERCPGGAEYNGCPQTLVLNHFAQGASNPVVEQLGNGPSTVETELTFLPCEQNLERQLPSSITVQFKVTNEFENIFSTSLPVTCWESLPLDEIAPRVFSPAVLGSRFAQTQMFSPPEQSGFLALAEEFHRQADGASSRAALNVHWSGSRERGDVIILPEGP
jgi:hypothetical protein